MGLEAQVFPAFQVMPYGSMCFLVPVTCFRHKQQRVTFSWDSFPSCSIVSVILRHLLRAFPRSRRARPASGKRFEKAMSWWIDAVLVLAVLDPISCRFDSSCIFRCLTGTRLKSFGKITRWEAETQAKSCMIYALATSPDLFDHRSETMFDSLVFAVWRWWICGAPGAATNLGWMETGESSCELRALSAKDRWLMVAVFAVSRASRIPTRFLARAQENESLPPH